MVARPLVIKNCQTPKLTYALPLRDCTTTFKNASSINFHYIFLFLQVERPYMLFEYVVLAKDFLRTM